jgi:hypothetical protein
MEGVKIQIKDSIPFAVAHVPKFRKPSELWHWLKSKYTFKNDKPGVEQLQTMQTMFGKKNVHGIPGTGDCDCITITAVASMLAQGWENIAVVIAGRKKTHPVHIYCVIYWKGERQVMDLTNRKFNFERAGYNYYQELPVGFKK